MAVSFQINNGFDGFQLSQITVGTVAPGAGDIQFCWNTTDGAGNTITRKDLVIALKAFTRWLESGPLLSTSPPL
jgi:hypothetical protein